MDKRGWMDVKEQMKRNFERGLKLLPQLKIVIKLDKERAKFKHFFRLSSPTNSKV